MRTRNRKMMKNKEKIENENSIPMRERSYYAIL